MDFYDRNGIEGALPGLASGEFTPRSSASATRPSGPGFAKN